MRMNYLPKLIIWAALSAMLLVCIFPKPKRYAYTSDFIPLDKKEKETFNPGSWEPVFNRNLDGRQFIFDLELYGRIRPNFVRMAVEVVALAFVGGGLAFSLRRPGSIGRSWN